MNSSDTIALRILKDVCGLPSAQIRRFPTGYCHSVYSVKDGDSEYVIRITDEESKAYYLGSLQWFTELFKLGIPVPEIIRHGQFENVFFTLISFLQGRDLGDVYHTLTDLEKRGIARSLSEIQRKVSSLPAGEFYGYTADDRGSTTWTDFLQSSIDKSRNRIAQNGLWGADICDTVSAKMDGLKDYFEHITPIAFLGDTTTKNVLVHQGKLAGIVDVDEICYGDPLFVVGLTHMALLKMEEDTHYIDDWLEAMSAGEAERTAMVFYTLLFCADFMGEQGMSFNNGNTVPVEPKAIEHLNSVYGRLCGML